RSLSGEEHGLTDEGVLGVLQRGSSDGDYRAGQFVKVLLAAVPVLSFLDHPGDPSGEGAVDLGEGGGEVTADVQQADRLACDPVFEVVQGVVGLGEDLRAEGVDGDGLLDLALREPGGWTSVWAAPR
uniref:hypothetical protein n=1 Tax=Streptomyces chartreusis TaxID=1969 RepID=UPI003D730042